MDDAEDQAARVVPATLEHEMQLIREAIAMVASGGAPRVVLAGIRFGETLLDPGRRLALDAGVRLVPLWRSDEAGADLAVERIPK
jgi:hypothetical protein